MEELRLEFGNGGRPRPRGVFNSSSGVQDGGGGGGATRSRVRRWGRAGPSPSAKKDTCLALALWGGERSGE